MQEDYSKWPNDHVFALPKRCLVFLTGSGWSTQQTGVDIAYPDIALEMRRELPEVLAALFRPPAASRAVTAIMREGNKPG